MRRQIFFASLLGVCVWQFYKGESLTGIYRTLSHRSLSHFSVAHLVGSLPVSHFIASHLYRVLYFCATSSLQILSHFIALHGASPFRGACRTFSHFMSRPHPVESIALFRIALYHSHDALTVPYPGSPRIQFDAFILLCTYMRLSDLGSRCSRNPSHGVHLQVFNICARISCAMSYTLVMNRRVRLGLGI